MSWFGKWFSSPSQKRSLDDDIQEPLGKKARVLFERSVAKNEFEFDPFVSIDSEDENLGQVVSSSLVSRPYALVAAINKGIELSLVPTSFCSLISESPAYICIGLSKDALPEDLPTSPTDSIAKTKEFTVSLVSEWIQEAAGASVGAYELPSDVMEADLKTGLTTSASDKVSVPRISESAVVLECRLRHRYSIKNSEGEVTSTVILAEVLVAAVKGGVLTANEAGEKVVDAKKLRPVAALGDALYAQLSEFKRLPGGGPSPTAPNTPPVGADKKPQEEIAEEVAEAVAEALTDVLNSDPQAAAVKAVQITLGEEVATSDGEIDAAQE